VGKAREVIVSMQQFLNDNPLSIWAKILTQSAARIWDHAADAGAYLANEIASGGNAVGAFINIGAGIGGAGMGELTTDVNKLQAAWDAMNKTVIGGFNVGAINKQFTEMRDAIGAVAQEQTGSSEAAAEAANTWSNLRNELDAANAKLNETGKVLEASEAQCNLWQHQIDLNSQAITRFQHANEIAQESINRLSSIKITGEAEADEKSFQTTQAINKLKLQILQAEQAHNYALASKLKLQVNELEKQKEIDDLAASITYDPQRREIEAALDPLHDQSETLQNILAGIRDQEGLIKANNAQMDILNAQNWDLEQKIIAERDRVWEMKIEYENTRKEVENLGAAINDMGANAVARWHEITAAIEAHNAALARAGGGAATPHHAGGLVMHTGGEVLAILKRKEFVMQEPAVEKYGTGFMNAVNSGSLPGGSPITVGDIHLHSVSPEYDVQQFYKLLNDTARRGAHLGRVLKGAKA
jgi:Flp pilus assembly protein TadG